MHISKPFPPQHSLSPFPTASNPTSTSDLPSTKHPATFFSTGRQAGKARKSRIEKKEEPARAKKNIPRLPLPCAPSQKIKPILVHSHHDMTSSQGCSCMKRMKRMKHSALRGGRNCAAGEHGQIKEGKVRREGKEGWGKKGKGPIACTWHCGKDFFQNTGRGRENS